MPPEPWFWTKVAVKPRVTEAWVEKKSREPWKVSSAELVVCSISAGELLCLRAPMFYGNLCLAASSPKALWAELEAGHQAKPVEGSWAIVGQDVWSIVLTCFRLHR